MEALNLYKRGIMAGVRFQIGNSKVTIEDLFKFPTRDPQEKGKDLNTPYERIAREKAAAVATVSLDNKVSSTSILDLKHAIIRDVYLTKLALEAEAAEKVAVNAVANDLGRRAVRELSKRTDKTMAKMTDLELLALIPR